MNTLGNIQYHRTSLYVEFANVTECYLSIISARRCSHLTVQGWSDLVEFLLLFMLIMLFMWFCLHFYLQCRWRNDQLENKSGSISQSSPQQAGHQQTKWRRGYVTWRYLDCLVPWFQNKVWYLTINLISSCIMTLGFHGIAIWHGKIPTRKFIVYQY